MNRLLLFLSFPFLLWQCQSDLSQAENRINDLETAYDTNPNGDNLDALLLAYEEDSTGRYLEKVAYLKIKNNRLNEGMKDLKQLLRENRDPKYALSLANAYEEQKAQVPAYTAYQAYLSAFPKDEQATTIRQKLPSDLPDLDARMADLFEQMKNDTIRRVQPRIASDFINSAEALALIHPSADSAAVYLRRAASFAQHYERDLEKTLYFYEWLIDDFPGTTAREFAMFSSAFLYDNEYGDIPKAQAFYQRFIKEYPNSDLVDDAAVSLEYLGKDDEEVLESLLRKQEG